jgi:hypothetical protein
MIKTIAYIFGAALLLYVLNVFYALNKWYNVKDEIFLHSDNKNYPEYFKPMIENLGEQDLSFTTFKKYKNEEEFTQFQSKKS